MADDAKTLAGLLYSDVLEIYGDESEEEKRMWYMFLVEHLDDPLDWTRDE